MNYPGIIKGNRNAISNWLRQFATFVDPDKRSYKLQESFLGIFRWGESLPLPKIDYVLVFKQLFAKCEACSIEEYENNDHSYYQVSLVHHKNRRIVVHETKDRRKAFNLGLELGNSLQTRIKDSASVRGESRWVDTTAIFDKSIRSKTDEQY